MRAQIDRDQYRRNMQGEVERLEREGLKLIEASVEDIKISDDRKESEVQGVCLGVWEYFDIVAHTQKFNNFFFLYSYIAKQE